MLSVCYLHTMNKSHRRNLEEIFSLPVLAGLEWRRIEALSVAFGARTIKESGSWVRLVLNDVVATFYRLHPAREAKPYQVRDARIFLENAGVKP
jgi:hypothetical protein